MLQYYDQRPIIFTDESMIVVDQKRNGAWQQKGGLIPEMFHYQESHPVSVMVFGAIGPDGYKSQLMKCPQSVSMEAYILMMIEN
jgi:hypothetical protein